MTRIIAWFVHNPVASNLLMLVLVVGGALSLFSLRREEFPNIDPKIVSISVEHRGAAPEEVERAVCIRIEEVVEGTSGIDRINATAAEGRCSVQVELLPDADADRAYDEIKNQVDGIDTFPVEAEKPVVSLRTMRSDVVRLAVVGNTDRRSLKEVAERLRDEISTLRGLSQVELSYLLPDEISIEVSEQALRRHGLTLDDVAHAVRRSSLDVPGGSIRTHGGEILLRTKGQAYRGADFEEIVVITHVDGTAITIGEIGRVIDGFTQEDVYARVDGRPAVVIEVGRVGDEDTVEIAREVERWLEDTHSRLPEGIDIVVFSDNSKELRARLNALIGSARSGLVLVLLVLGLFLRFRIAVWVAAGVPISFLGAAMLFPVFDLTISTVVIMAAILVLGILVDDAIVVGESIHAHEARTPDRLQAAIDGAVAVHVPVIFGVLTTVAAFAPLLMVEGRMGQMFSVLGATVVLCLLFSLMEAHVILPGHLAHRRTEVKASDASPIGRHWIEIQERFSSWLERLASAHYGRALRKSVEFRYTTLAVAIGLLIVSAAVVQSGRLRFQFFPSVDGESVRATVTLPPGSPVELTEAAVATLERSLEAVRAELDGDSPGPSNIAFTMTAVGSIKHQGGPGGSREVAHGAHVGEVVGELLPFDRRKVGSRRVVDRWRELTPPIPGALETRFDAEGFGPGDPVAVRLRGDDVDLLARAAQELKAGLTAYPGVFDVRDSFLGGKQEVVLALRPEARTLGLTQDDLGRQVRNAFFGAEVQRVQRGRDDVRVMVRFPEEERRSLLDLEEMQIRTADGTAVPFGSVAFASVGRGSAAIERADRQRVVDVIAAVDRAVTTPEAVIAHFVEGLPELLSRYPGVTFSLEGEQRESSKAMAGLARGAVIALLLIYALLAIPLHSYTQPLIIMCVIPFGSVGAALGHLIMRHDLTFTSVIGMVALAGVVVNSSLVLVHFVNSRRSDGMSARQAVIEGGVARFRPIFLTSVTTFVGLVPLMFEADPAAFMVVPLAISLAFGVALASVITLFLVPSLYAILEDLTLWRRQTAERPGPLGIDEAASG